MFRQPQQPDTDDQFEVTQGGDAPPDIGGHFVSFRGRIYIPEERRRVQLDGVFHLIQSNGWRIEDMYFLSADRQPFPQAISMARDFNLLLEPQPVAGNPLVHAPLQPAVLNAVKAKAWYEHRVPLVGVAKIISAFFSSKAAKTIGAILLVVRLSGKKRCHDAWSSLSSTCLRD